MKQKRADRRCVICDGSFTPKKDEQRSCGFRCARTLAGRTAKGKATPAALVLQQRVNASRRTERIANACVDQFGPLTAREAAIFGFADEDGYTRGYRRGYHARSRSGKAGAA